MSETVPGVAVPTRSKKVLQDKPLDPVLYVC